MKGFLRVFLIVTGSLVWVTTALADGFGINTTRLIYPEGVNSITVTVRNTMSDQPYLVQAMVTMAPDNLQTAPFNVTPPLFRLEPNTTNQMRIIGQVSHLPKDRESVFYFNARAIPASRTSPTESQSKDISGTAQFGVGNIIKIFYRPAGLSGSSDNAQRDLQFEPVGNGLKVTNSSPYFINLAELTVGGQKLSLMPPNGVPMIAPFGTHTYPTRLKRGQVSWKTITDQGAQNGFVQAIR
ncbi:Chaperone protein fimC precursor [Pragia fontium]|uniref:fimbrial biogenesis chaperone n=1 Tax=Pragia fontium TaxID=82985 RepID=UPI000DFBB882|nr:molecular chaperone [Pragia fontium]SUB82576.1 Chaperone protein fimC precursor [Pragia fontium]